MKSTRILLFMSPLLWFVPPLIHVNDILGLAMLNYFYKGVLGAFPANVLMAYLCYTYADQLGREGWLWAAGSLRYPFIAPLILAFVPPKDGSAADLHEGTVLGPRPRKLRAARLRRASRCSPPILGRWRRTSARKREPRWSP